MRERFNSVRGIVLALAILVLVGVIIAAAVRHQSSPGLAQRGPFTCPSVTMTNQQMAIDSNQFSFDGKPAPTGSMVAAFSPQHALVGCTTTTVVGTFQLVVYGVDPSGRAEIAKYLKLNDPIALEVDGLAVPPANLRITGTNAQPAPRSLIFLPGTPRTTIDVALAVTSK